MKVITTNHPIIVNGNRESKASDYLTASGQAEPDDYYSAEGISTDIISTKNPIVVGGKDISNPTWYVSAEGGRMSAKRTENIQKRIAKNEKIKANAQKRIDAINSRVQASGKPMGRVDENIIRGLQKQIARVQAMIDKLNAMLSSGADGDDYYGADANPPAVVQGGTPNASQIADAKKKGLFWDKVKGGWVYAKEGGILDWVGNLLGVQVPPAFQPTGTPTGGTTGGTTGGNTGSGTKDDDGKGMSKTTKTLLMVGGALVVGFVVYKLVKPKNQ